MKHKNRQHLILIVALTLFRSTFTVAAIVGEDMKLYKEEQWKCALDGGHLDVPLDYKAALSFKNESFACRIQLIAIVFCASCIYVAAGQKREFFDISEVPEDISQGYTLIPGANVLEEWALYTYHWDCYADLIRFLAFYKILPRFNALMRSKIPQYALELGVYDIWQRGDHGGYVDVLSF